MRTLTATIGSMLGVVLLVAHAPAQTRGTAEYPERGTSAERRQHDARQWLDDFDRKYSTVTSYNDYPSAQVDKVPAAAAGAATARAQQSQSYSDLNRVIRWQVEDFENTPELREARQELDDAYTDYLAARDRALGRLADDPTYRAAVNLRDQMGANLSELHAMREKDHGSIVAVANVKLTHASVARDLEAAALGNDAQVSAARKRMIDASNKLSQLRGDFRRQVQRDEQVAQARDSFNDARIARLGAEAYLHRSIQAARSAVDYSYNLHRYDRYRYSGYDDGYCDDYGSIYSGRY